VRASPSSFGFKLKTSTAADDSFAAVFYLPIVRLLKARGRAAAKIFSLPCKPFFLRRSFY
jgi:hypothetical protein